MATKRSEAKEPAKPKAKKISAKAAQDAARAGDLDTAIPVLVAAADAGDVGAACSLAEIHALRGEWDQVIARAAPLADDPAAIGIGNVKRDMAGLLWRAAEETGRWNDVLSLVRKLPRQAVGGLLYDSLIVLLEAQGKGPPPTMSAHGTPPEQRMAGYEVNAKRARETNDAKLLFLSARADSLFDEQAVEAYPRAKDALDFMQTLDAARAFVRTKRVEEAWKATEPRLRDWISLVHAQVAPVVFLYDPHLRPMMNAERSASVLSRNRARSA